MARTDPLDLIIQINFVIVAALLIAAFSLLVYLLAYYFQSRSARGAAWLLASVSIVYLGDLVLFFVADPRSAEPRRPTRI
jgi:archaellum component FlaG (FlaF/FlaG flagellin family)